jgi:hypothetical protein
MNDPSSPNESRQGKENQKYELHTTRKSERRKFRDFMFYRYQIKRVNCSLIAGRYRQLVRESKIYGLKPTKCLEEAGFAFFEKRDLETVQEKEDRLKMVHFLNRIAASLNQIARHTNTAQKITFFELQKAADMVRELRDELEKFMTDPNDRNQKPKQ